MMEKKYTIFMENIRGNLSNEILGLNREEKWSDLWYIFIPNNCTKTLAEMSDEERDNRPDDRTSATDEFINWYIQNYKKVKKLIK